MAKTSENNQGGKAKPDGGKTEPRFEIRTPSNTFTGHRAKVRFIDGVGNTDDKAAAEACLDFGYQVTDRESGKVLNPLKTDGATAAK